MGRIIACCPALRFRQPTDEITKTTSLLQLIANGENIAMTHELFARQELTPKLYQHIREYGYTLVLDEVLEVIEPVTNILQDDVDLLFGQGWIEAGENGVVRWLAGDKQTARFKDVRAKARSHTLIWYDRTLFLWVFPQEILRAFDQVYVLTFLFSGSHMKHYLDLHGMGMTMCHVRDGELRGGPPDLTSDKMRIAALVEVYDGPLNRIGDANTALSRAWFRKHGRGDLGKVLFRNARNMLMNRYKAASSGAMWSCFASERKRIKDYSSAFVACNARATNVHRERNSLAYLLNVFDHPYVIRWFADQGAGLNGDAFALCQLLQWIWRSAIRDGKPVRLYIPSRRMRML